jgi:predicted Zn-ribbon and HTH transcriptional regulator
MSVKTAEEQNFTNSKEFVQTESSPKGEAPRSSNEELIKCKAVKSLLATTIPAKCLKCGHDWNYKGKSEKRIHCPKCGRQQVDYNRRRFGKWRP